MTLEELGKFVAINLKWPLLLPDLERDPELLSKLQAVALGTDTASAVGRWGDREDLLAFLRAGIANERSVPDPSKESRWTLAHVNVTKLLQVSPRVRTIETRPVTLPGETGTAARVAEQRDGRPPREERARAYFDASPTGPESEIGQARTREAAVKEIFSRLPANMNANTAKGMHSVIQFNLTGEGGGNYYLMIEDGTCMGSAGTHASPNTTMTMAAQDYVDMITGKLNWQMALMSGKTKIAGDLGLAMRMQTLFGLPLSSGAARTVAEPSDAARSAAGTRSPSRLAEGEQPTKFSSDAARGGPGSAEPEAPVPTAAIADDVKAIFNAMPPNFNADAAKGMDSVIQFNLTGDGGGGTTSPSRMARARSMKECMPRRI